MGYIVLDMEWNQPCSRNRKVKHPVVLNGEIIQIGAVKLDENLQETDQLEVKITPKFYQKLHKSVEALTDIHAEDLAGGVTFAEAAEQLRSFCGEENILLTWGPCDVRRLEENLLVHGLDCGWIPETFDAQVMFDFQETWENRCFSLDYAVYYFGIKGSKAHDALNDARDTAAVIRRLDLQEFIAEERAWRAECDSAEIA